MCKYLFKQCRLLHGEQLSKQTAASCGVEKHNLVFSGICFSKINHNWGLKTISAERTGYIQV